MNRFATINDGAIGEYICLDSISDVIAYVNVDKYPQPDGEIAGFDFAKKEWILADKLEPLAVDSKTQAHSKTDAPPVKPVVQNPAVTETLAKLAKESK
jgi:hypothetical protein